MNQAVKITTRILFMVLTISLTMFSGEPLLAQVNSDSSAVIFNNAFLGARSAALANTQVSDSYSIESIHTNPAAFLFSRNNTTMSTSLFYNSFHNVMIEQITGVFFRNDRHMLAAGAMYRHSNRQTIESLRTNGFPLEFAEYGASLHYAARIGPTLGLGGGINGKYGTTEFQSDWILSSTIGLYYTPSATVSYGMAYSGFGGNLNLFGSEFRYTFSDSLEGSSGQSGTAIQPEKLSHQLEVGATFRFPTLTNRPNFLLSFANKKIFGHDGLIYKIGMEFSSLEVVVFRAGYYLSDYKNGVRLGLGFRIAGTMIDYAFSETMTGLNGNSHQITVSLDL